MAWLKALISTFVGVFQKPWHEFSRRVLRRYPKRPSMAFWEIITMKELLVNKVPSRVLEWGSGYSTALFPSFLPIGAVWTAIEHDPQWFGSIDTSAEVKLIEANQPWTGDGSYEEFSDYVAAPEGKYDVIIVDGRARNACLELARRHLAENGVVVLHDANRVEYITDFYRHRLLLLSMRSSGLGLALLAEDHDPSRWLNLPYINHMRKMYIALERVWLRLGL